MEATVARRLGLGQRRLRRRWRTDPLPASRPRCWAPRAGARRTCWQLRHLDISAIGRDPTVLSATYDDLLGAIAQLRRLKFLSMSNTKLGEEGGVLLARVILLTPNLQHLGIVGTSMGDTGLCAIAASLPYMPQLKSIRAGRNFFGDGSYQALQLAAARQGMTVNKRAGFLIQNISAPVLSMRERDRTYGIKMPLVRCIIELADGHSDKV